MEKAGQSDSFCPTLYKKTRPTILTSVFGAELMKIVSSVIHFLLFLPYPVQKQWG